MKFYTSVQKKLTKVNIVMLKVYLMIKQIGYQAASAEIIFMQSIF